MMSVCPGDTGNASATASAWALLSSTRSAGRRQNGQSLGLEPFIVSLDAPVAEGPYLLVVGRLKLLPETRVEADISQVSIVAQETPALELLKRHAEHQPLNPHFVQLIHRDQA